MSVSTTVSNVYVVSDNKRSATYAFNVREQDGERDVVTRHRFSSREEAETERAKFEPPTCAEAVATIPLRETIDSVLRAFEGTEISTDYLAVQIEGQVQAWIKLNLEQEND